MAVTMICVCGNTFRRSWNKLCLVWGQVTQQQCLRWNGSHNSSHSLIRPQTAVEAEVKQTNTSPWWCERCVLWAWCVIHCRCRLLTAYVTVFPLPASAACASLFFFFSILSKCWNNIWSAQNRTSLFCLFKVRRFPHLRRFLRHVIWPRGNKTKCVDTCQEMSKSACGNLWRGCTILFRTFLPKKCAERGLKEPSWAEPGRRVGHKKLGTGEEEDVGGGEPAAETGVGWGRDLVWG